MLFLHHARSLNNTLELFVDVRLETCWLNVFFLLLHPDSSLFGCLQSVFVQGQTRMRLYNARYRTEDYSG